MENNEYHWNVLVPWVLATMAGLVLGVLSILSIVSRLALVGTSTTLVGLVGGAGIGAGVGIAQWLVLRRYMQGGGWWAVLSVAGGMIGVALGLTLSDALLPLFGGVFSDALQSRPTSPTIPWGSAVSSGIAGAVLGVTLGVAQWSVLRQHIPSSGWWVVVSGLAWMTGLSMGAAMIGVGGVVGSVLLAGVVIGLGTGALLVHLLYSGAAPGREGTTP